MGRQPVSPAELFTVGGRYRDTTTREHVLVLYHAPPVELFPETWHLIVTAEAGGVVTQRTGESYWITGDGLDLNTGAELWRACRYAPLPDDAGTVLAELRCIAQSLAEEVDPDDDGEWDAERLPNLGHAAARLFAALDGHLLDGGALPPEWAHGGTEL